LYYTQWEKHARHHLSRTEWKKRDSIKKETEKGIRLFFAQSHKGKTAYVDVINKMPAGARDENNNNNNNNMFSADTYPSPILIPWPHHTRVIPMQVILTRYEKHGSCGNVTRYNTHTLGNLPLSAVGIEDRTPNPNIGRYCCTSDNFHTCILHSTVL